MELFQQNPVDCLKSTNNLDNRISKVIFDSLYNFLLLNFEPVIRQLNRVTPGKNQHF